MYSTSAVANEFLEIAKKDNKDLTNLKLVKLMYIAQGLSLAFFDKPIFDSNIEAWKYGPVVPEIYHEFKFFKANPITTKSVDLDGINWTNYQEPKLDDTNSKKVVQLVWNWYKDISAERLVELTHSKGTPWSLTYIDGLNNVIPNELIKEYYKRFLENMESNIKGQ